MDYTAGRGTTALGIIGTVLGGAAVAGNGLVGNLLGGNTCATGDSAPVNRYDMNLIRENMAKDGEIALLKADKYTDQKLVEVYKDLRGIDKEQSAVIGNLASRVAAIETAAPLREQIVLGKIGEVATLATNGINCLTSQVNCLAATVAGITKSVVPITAVCPQPMPQYNSWTAPAPGGTTGGTTGQ
jgi:hypothetical protein